jgi:hypothetical protein
MAYIARQTTQEFSSAATATPTLLAHAADDVIFFVITQDGGGTAISVTVATGWTVYNPGSASGGSRQALAYKKAASSSETAPVFNGANDQWILQQFILKDVDTSTAPDFTPASSAWNVVSSKASPSATSANAGTLLFYSWGSDSNQQMRHKISEAVYLDNWRHSNGDCASLVCYYQQVSAGSVPSVTMYAIDTNEGGHAWVIGFRNKSGGSLQPMPIVSANELRWYGNYGTLHDDTTTWGDADDITGGSTIGGLAVSTVAPTISTLVRDSTPNGRITLVEHNTNLGAASWIGGAHTITTTDMTGKALCIQWDVSQVSTSVFGAEGVLLLLGDTGGGWVAYRLSKRQDVPALYPAWSQLVVNEATEYASSGTFNVTNVNRVGYAYHRLSGSALSLYIGIKNLILLDKVTLRSGGSSSPCSPSVVANALNAEWFYRQAERQGSSQTLAKCLIQIGDGSSATYYDGSATSFEFPPEYNADKFKLTNVDPLSLGLSVLASANDTINITSCLLGANQAQTFVIDGSSSNSASYDFTGASFTGPWAPTLKTGVPVVGATFSGCGEIEAKGATVTNCNILNTSSADAAIAFSATDGTLDGTTIDVTGTSAAYHLEVGDGGTGNFAITLTDVTFTGTPGTDKVHVTNTSGTTTITTSGTTSLVAGDVTTAGATVSIVSDPVNQVVVVSGFTSGSRIQIYDTTNATELFNGTASAGNTVISGTTATWTDPVAATGNRAIRVRVSYVSGATAKGFLELTGLTAGTTSGTASITYPVTQVADTTYDNNAIDGSTVTGVTFTDSSSDVVNIDVASNSITWPSIYAAWVYYAFTSTGIATDIDYIDGVDTANYILSNMKIKNTSSPSDPLVVSGGYGRDSTTGATVDLVDTTGGTLIFAPDHVVSYAVGSGVTAGDVTDIAAAVLTAASSAPIHANIKKVADTTVNGSGTEASPWGP